MADELKDALTNPKRVLQKREQAAMGEDDGKSGKDAGNLPGSFQMSQSKFSGYKDGMKKGPPAEMLKRQAKD